MNLHEVKRALEGHVFRGSYEHYQTKKLIEWEASGWSVWDNRVPVESGEYGEPETVPGLGVVEMADTYTGGEGGGEDAEMVFRITFPDGAVRYFRKEGRYFSYDGTHWEYGGFREVAPTQKTITVYEEV